MSMLPSGSLLCFPSAIRQADRTIVIDMRGIVAPAVGRGERHDVEAGAGPLQTIGAKVNLAQGKNADGRYPVAFMFGCSDTAAAQGAAGLRRSRCVT